MSEPAGRSAWAAIGSWAVLITALIAIYLASDRALPSTGTRIVSDKVLHFGAYAVLAVLWFAALRTTWPAQRASIQGWIAAGCASVYGATDEWHQSFVDGRVCDVWDWVADAGGAAAVAVLVTAWATLRRRGPEA